MGFPKFRQWCAVAIAMSLLTTQVFASPAVVQQAFSVSRRPFVSPEIVRNESIIPQVDQFISEIQPYLQVESQSLEDNGKPTVFLFRDVHLVPRAQFGISSALRQINKFLHRSGEKIPFVVGVEAANGLFDFRPFRQFPDQDALANAANTLLESNQISAISHFGLTGEKPLPLIIGVDDPKLYRANVNALRRAKPRQSDTLERLKNGRIKILAAAVSKVSDEVAVFLRRYSDYLDGDLSLEEFAPYLISEEEPFEFEQLELYRKASRLESELDQERFAAERDTLIKNLIEKNPSTRSLLIDYSNAYQAGTLSVEKFYEKLLFLLETSGSSMVNTPHFRAYLEYLRYVELIRPDRLFEETDKAAESTVVRIAGNNGGLRYLRELEKNHLEQLLTRFELTSSEWDRYYRKINNDPFQDFYLFASERNKTMVRELMRALNESDASYGVLITGGFHSDELASLFNAKGVSTVTFSPRLSLDESETAADYLSVFFEEPSALSRLFESPSLTLGSASLNLGVRKPFKGYFPTAVGSLVVLLSVAAAANGRIDSIEAAAISAASLGVIAAIRMAGKNIKIRFKNRPEVLEIAAGESSNTMPVTKVKSSFLSKFYALAPVFGAAPRFKYGDVWLADIIIASVIVVVSFLTYLAVRNRRPPKNENLVSKLGKVFAKGHEKDWAPLLVYMVKKLGKWEHFAARIKKTEAAVRQRDQNVNRIADLILKQPPPRRQLILNRLMEQDLQFHFNPFVRIGVRRLLQKLDVYVDLNNKVNLADTGVPSIEKIAEISPDVVVAAWVPAGLKTLHHQKGAEVVDMVGAAHVDPVNSGAVKDGIDIHGMHLLKAIYKRFHYWGMPMASEGAGRDEVEAIVAGEEENRPSIARVFLSGAIFYVLTLLNVVYPSGAVEGLMERNLWKRHDLALDIVENTNSTATDNKGISFGDLTQAQGGGTTQIVTGPAVGSIDYLPDVYADQIVSTVSADKRSDFDALDPLINDTPIEGEDESQVLDRVTDEMIARLTKIAEANGKTLSDLEVIWLNRGRHAKESDGHRDQVRGDALERISRTVDGFVFTPISDGTLDAAIHAGIGRKTGKHLVFWGTSGSPEAMQAMHALGQFYHQPFANNRVAIGAMRIYSKNVNRSNPAVSAKNAVNLGNRTAWSEKEKEMIRKRKDGEAVLNGSRVIRLSDVAGEAKSSRGIITNSGLWNLEGVNRVGDAPDGAWRFRTRVVRIFLDSDGFPKWTVEQYIIRNPNAVLSPSLLGRFINYIFIRRLKQLRERFEEGDAGEIESQVKRVVIQYGRLMHYGNRNQDDDAVQSLIEQQARAIAQLVQNQDLRTQEAVHLRLMETDLNFHDNPYVRRAVNKIQKVLGVYHKAMEFVELNRTGLPSSEEMANENPILNAAALIPAVLKSIPLVGAAKVDPANTDVIKDRLEREGTEVFKTFARLYRWWGLPLTGKYGASKRNKIFTAGIEINRPYFLARLVYWPTAKILRIVSRVFPSGTLDGLADQFTRKRNYFVFDAVDNPAAIAENEENGTTQISVGEAVESLKYVPNVYADQIVTSILPDHLNTFSDLDPSVPGSAAVIENEEDLDPAVSVAYDHIMSILQTIARANSTQERDLQISDLEVLWLDRGEDANDEEGHRDTIRGRVFKRIEEDVNGFKLHRLSGGTAIAAVAAGIGRSNGKHLVLWSTSRARPAMAAMASLATFHHASSNNDGRIAVGAVRLYSESVNYAEPGQREVKTAKSLANRYAWTDEEKQEIKKRGVTDATEIINHTGVIRLSDLNSNGSSAHGVITRIPLLSLSGVTRVDDAADGSHRYQVLVFRTTVDSDGKPKWWVEPVVLRNPFDFVFNRLSKKTLLNGIRAAQAFGVLAAATSLGFTAAPGVQTVLILAAIAFALWNLWGRRPAGLSLPPLKKSGLKGLIDLRPHLLNAYHANLIKAPPAADFQRIYRDQISQYKKGTVVGTHLMIGEDPARIQDDLKRLDAVLAGMRKNRSRLEQSVIVEVFNRDRIGDNLFQQIQRKTSVFPNDILIRQKSKKPMTGSGLYDQDEMISLALKQSGAWRLTAFRKIKNREAGDAQIELITRMPQNFWASDAIRRLWIVIAEVGKGWITLDADSIKSIFKSAAEALKAA